MNKNFKLAALALSLGLAFSTGFAGGEGECAHSATKDAAACKDHSATKDAAACKDHSATKDAAACKDHGAKAACCAAKTEMSKGGGGGDMKGDAEAKAEGTAYGVGSTVEAFTLVDAKSGKDVNLADLKGKDAVVLAFWNQTCPFVKEAAPRFAEFAKGFEGKNVAVVAIDSNNTNEAGEIKEYAKDQPFSLLMNPDSKVAARFGATRTPEVFILDKDLVVQYHGAFDNGREGEKGDRKSYAKDAVDALVAGKKPAVSSTKAFGCSIKYAEGVSPLKGKNENS